MATDVHWIDTGIPLKLAIMGRPRAGDWLEGEVDHWHREGIEIVVSLLQDEEVLELGLQAEADMCRARGIEFVSFPIADRDVPGDAQSVAELIRSVVAGDKAVAIHCRIGIGRSSVVAASILKVIGMDTETAFKAIAKVRGTDVPDTGPQREWVRAFDSDILTAS